MEEIQSVQDMPPGRVRDYLGKFLFSGDDVFKKIAVLSGGERGRVALAKLALGGANLLLLDEPTNHLDIPAQEVLQAVLADFPGTILLVSHDRYLIDALATQIWSVEDGALELFKGTWTEYVAARDGQEREKLVDKLERGARAPVPAAAKLDPEARRQKSEERKRVARLGELEGAIAALEQRLARLARDLEEAGTAGDVARVRALGQEYALVQAELNTRLVDWEQLAA
jgi:ATP-binding cassette subfamily F protein 3